MRFDAAWIWLLALPLPLYLWWLGRRSYAQLAPWARTASLSLRIVVLALLVGAMTRPAWLKSSDRRHVVFLLDCSQSISADNVAAGLDQIDRLAKAALESHANTHVSLIAFGRAPALQLRESPKWTGWPEDLREKLNFAASLRTMNEQRAKLMAETSADRDSRLKTLDERIATLEKFRDDVAGDFTDADRALRLACNCGSTDDSRTIYLLTDANFNRGDWSAAVAAARVPVHTILLDRPAPPEVAVAEVALPASVRVDQGFSADVRVASTVDTSAELRVFKDGFLHHEKQVALKPGDNAFKVPGLFFREKGFHNIEATIRAAQDTQVANNRGRALVVVPGEARVLYVDRDADAMPYLKNALELEGIQVEPRSPAGIPRSLGELLSFDAFILCNVPAERLSLRQMQMIRTYVQDFGGGFVMLGGDESFGLGGYYNTPIEEILPVKMPIQKDMIRPSLALMLVFDKSGSMEGAKIQLAKRAAISTAEVINPRDLIGLVAFDGEAHVVLDLTPASDRATIINHVSTLEAGGGTFLYPALVEAQSRLTQSNARRKHVIILSDGQTQGFGYEDQARALAADGITISCVGIGEGADMKLLEAIADNAGGRAYFTNDFQTIPQIFTREALRASKSMLVERLVQPSVVSDDPALEEIDADELPVLTGYVATTPRPAANTIIISDNGDPLLAKWRYGLGRTVAFTSEPKPRWAEDWIEWEDFAKFWSQLIRSITGQDLRRTVHVECAHEPRDDSVMLTADIRDNEGGFLSELPVELTANAADGKSEKLPLRLRAPGLFEALVPRIKFGEDQQFVFRIDNASNPTGDAATTSKPANPDAADQLVSYGFVFPFSPEFATLGPSSSTTEQIRARAAGEVTSVGQARLVDHQSPAQRWLALWPYLLAAALLLVPLDILVRRLS